MSADTNTWVIFKDYLKAFYLKEMKVVKGLNKGSHP